MSRSLDDLSSRFKPKAIMVLARLVERGIPILIVDTLRTEAEQRAHVAKGTSVTMLSKHLPRRLRGAVVETDPDRDKADAMDICPYEMYALHGPDKLQWDTHDPVWKVIGEIVEAEGLRWGGRWRTPHDPGHMELTTPV
jgi:hypothetical protein